MSVTTTSTDTAVTVTPDLAAVKAKQQQTWSSGDFHVIAALIQPTAEQLVDSADLHAGMRVLDVATGSGNAAIAAARLGCTVEGADYVPALLERGRRPGGGRGLRHQVRRGRRRGAALRGRRVRRRHDDLRLDVRARTTRRRPPSCSG